jgi:hypothetical protein
MKVLHALSCNTEQDTPSSSRVLAQVDTDGRFPMAVEDEPSVADGDVSVKCKPISGKADSVTRVDDVSVAAP